VAVPKATEQMKEMAKRFKGANEKETCQNIFNFLLHNIQYKADGENQIIRLPSALLHTKQGDCKSYSLFTAAVLNNLNIPCHFVLQSFSSDPTPSHIYCATDNGILIDAVYKKFNQEKTPTYKYNIPVMKVTHMSGIANSGTPVNGLGDWLKKNVAAPVKQAANYVKNEVEDLNLKKYTLSIPRQIILGIFSLNIDGMASKIQKQNSQAKWERKWISFGGDAQALSRAIKDGASKSPKNLGFLDKVKYWIDQKVGINGIGATADQNALVKKQLGDGGALKSTWESAIYGLSTGLGAGVGALLTGGPGAAAGGPAGTLIGDIIISNTDSIVDMIYPVEPGASITQNADSPSVGKKSGSGFITPEMQKKIDAEKAKAQTSYEVQAKAESKSNMLLLGAGALVVVVGGLIYANSKKSKSKK
jgi:hypothetical protein